jgi:hypothetical protein
MKKLFLVIKITKMFLKLKVFHNNVQKINFREPQKIYSRRVFSSFVVESSEHQHNKEYKTECVSSAYRFSQLYTNFIFTICSVIFLIRKLF